jgi:hypothetical protein
LSKNNFALWWIPSLDDRCRFQSVINSLARVHSTTAFSPHITVCSSITDADVAIELGEQLATIYRPFEVSPECLEHGNDFYRAFTIRLKSDISLQTAHANCVDKMSGKNAPYVPHLSLMYQQVSRFDRGVFQQCPDDILRVFAIDRLDLIDVRGKTQDWRRLKSFQLD